MAMLDLSETERASLKAVFDEISCSFSALDDYETDGAEPLVSVVELHNVLREDVSAKFIQREELLENAPEQQNGYFQVPAAID